MGGEKLKASRLFFFVFLLFFLLFFGSLAVLSAQTAEPQEEARPQAVDESAFILGEGTAAPVINGGSSIFVVLRMVLVLTLAALAIYGVVFFIKRLARPQEIRDPHLKVLARVPLGNDSFTAVISLGPRAWLVGGGAGGVNLISEVEDTETLETMLLDEARKNAEVRRFFDFRSLFRKPGNDGPSASHLDTLRNQRERLKRL